MSMLYSSGLVFLLQESDLVKAVKGGTDSGHLGGDSHAEERGQAGHE